MNWTLAFSGFEPEAERLRETLCTLGNGRFATRGATLGSVADAVHYPGTYIAGGYDRQTSKVADREIENEDLVNWPNWLPVLVRAGDGEWLHAAPGAVLDYAQSLDMRSGTLTRDMRLVDQEGRVTRLVERRLVSMRDGRLAALRVEVRPEGWSGRMVVRTFLDGRVRNAGVPRYQALEGRHFEVVSTAHPRADTTLLVSRSLQSRLEVAMAVRTRVEAGSGPVRLRGWSEGGQAGCDAELGVEAGGQLHIEKVLALVTSRDPAIAATGITAIETVREAPAFSAVLRDHTRAWRALWDDFDIRLGNEGGEAQRHLRLNILHLNQTLSPHTAELDVGAPARGWHGEAYRGHIFWDELFVFRVLNLRAPRLTRALLLYRYRRLPAARRLAWQAGLPGALFPWQSGSDGREESQAVHLNPSSGRWVADDTHRQRHVGLALAYNIWSYWRASGDRDFMTHQGVEMLVEIARAFTGLAGWDAAVGRYRIRGVVGPDEFHTAYPGRTAERGGGIDDNAYTNVFCSWVLTRAIDALEILPPSRRRHLDDALQLTADEVGRWQKVSEELYVPFLPNGLVAQFEGYGDLEELDWEGYRARYDDIHRLDRILEAEGRDVNDYKASKQADVLMLLFLFSAEELVQVFEQMGYVFDPADIPRLVEYYEARTSHGSTLSRAVHAWVVARSDRRRSWELLCETLRADVDDVQGGSTEEGIHLGAMCGAIDIIQAGYLGIEVRAGVLNFNPVLPDALRDVETRVRYRGQDVTVKVTHKRLRIAAGASSEAVVTVAYRGRLRHLPPRSETSFRLVRPRSARAPTGETASGV